MGIIKDTHYQLNSHNMKELMDKLEHTFAYLYQQRNPKDSYQCMMHFRHNNKVLMDQNHNLIDIYNPKFQKKIHWDKFQHTVGLFDQRKCVKGQVEVEGSL